MPAIVYAPQPGPQRKLVASTVYEVLYGGSKGGGKTMGVVLVPSRNVHLPKFKALILRRESKDLGDILDKSRDVYQSCFDCRFIANHALYPPHWRFQSGALVALSHCHDQEDWQKYEGQEYQIIEFDELPQFTERQYLKIAQRLRGIVPGLPQHVRYLRSTATPGAKHSAWVFRRWAAWLSSKFEHPLLPARFDPATGKQLPPAASGQVLYFLRNKRGQEEIVPPGTKGSRTRTFIRARLSDNKLLEQADPNYRKLLESLDPVSRAQALDGDWEIREARGMMFPREKWKVRVAPPSRVLLAVRFWDLGASEDGDYCSGTKVCLCEDGQVWIDDHIRRRGDADSTNNLIIETTARDPMETIVRIEQEAGAGAKITINNFVHELLGRDIAGETMSGKGNKIMRARPFSAQVNAGNVYVREAPWNGEFFDEYEDFPEVENDDQVDSGTGAFNELAKLQDFTRLAKISKDLERDAKLLARAFDHSGMRGLKSL